MEPPCWSQSLHSGRGLEGQGLEVCPPQAPTTRKALGPHNQVQPVPCLPRPQDQGCPQVHVWGRSGNFWSLSPQSQTQQYSTMETPPSWDRLPKSEQANSQVLTNRYQDWSSRAEDHLLSTRALSQRELESSKGRGAPPSGSLPKRVPPTGTGVCFDQRFGIAMGSSQKQAEAALRAFGKVPT